jgi:hypothetical protein
MKKSFQPVSFNTWFDSTKLHEITDKKIILVVPMALHKRMFLSSYYDLISDAFAEITGVQRELDCLLEDEVVNEVESVSNTLFDETISVSKEHDEYFESNLTMVYYLITEFLLMTDSRAKNMMLCTFTARCTDNDGNSKTKWFPIFYDMDTGLCVNNMGQLKFTYKDEDWYEDIFNAEAGYIN